MKTIKIFSILLLSLFLIGMVSADNYIFSNPKMSPGVPSSSFSNAGFNQYDKSFCQEGQDFIVQVAPAGCTPVVVRSDLLEEEDVNVFCQLQAIKINPLVSVESISHISFSGSPPEGVRSIAYHPNRAALNRNGELNGMSWNNIGYIVLTLRQEVNESAMPEFVSGNIVANIRYNFDKEAGFGRQTFYLPEIDDGEFEKNIGLYSFFKKRAYVRAENIDTDKRTAEIGIYSDRLDAPGKEGSTKKEKIRNFPLEIGEKEDMLLPGYDCMASIDVRLHSLASEEERVRLSINSELIEVREGEKFLDNKCVVKDIDKRGLDQSVEISCHEDGKGRSSFLLYITPKVKLNVNGAEGSYSVGDWVYNDGETPVYLGYASSDGNVPNDLKLQLIRAPRYIGEKTISKLEESEIRVARAFIKAGKEENFINDVSAFLIEANEWVINGENYEELTYGETVELFNSKVSIVGIGGGENRPLGVSSTENGDAAGEESRYNYDSSVGDYDTVINSFFSEKNAVNNASKELLSETSLREKIDLALKLQQNNDLELFCQEFKMSFSESSIPIICSNKMKIANSGVSTRDVLVNKNHKTISFEGIHVPNFNDYGASVRVTTRSKGTVTHKLMKGKSSYFDGDNSIILTDLNSNNAEVTVSIAKSSAKEGDNIETKNLKLVPGVRQSVDGNVFVLEYINLNKVAKVIVETSRPVIGTEANFSFSVGIEKRSIQLSPEKTKKRIDKLNKTLANWNRISDNLGNVVEGMKTACLATGTALTLKNLIVNSDGKGVARKETMKKWRVKCQELLESDNSKFNTMDGCYFANADEIEENVTSYYDSIKDVNEELEIINKNAETEKNNLLGENEIDFNKAFSEYSDLVSDGMSKDGVDASITRDGTTKTISASSVLDIINKGNPSGENIFTIDDLKNIRFYSNIGDSESLYLAYEQIIKNRKVYDDTVAAKANAKSSGYEANFLSTPTSEDAVEGDWEGAIANEVMFSGAHAGEKVQGIVMDNVRYFVILSGTDKGGYSINEVYDENQVLVSKEFSDEVKKHYTIFRKSNLIEKNPFKVDAKVRFFDSEPYKNLPSFVPIDVDGGWYARMEYTLPSFNGLRAYDESGMLNSFDLCNVGYNGIPEEAGVDKCIGINMRNMQDVEMRGANKEELNRLVGIAKNEIIRLSKSSKRTGTVTINGKEVEIGAPTATSINGDCSDFMSPKECKVLFNLCDPVICPSSRCNLGGEYNVRDVIQSGIVGSVALCLPNAKEGIIAPICLTGVKAGIDGLLSTGENYRDCLQESLDTGKTVGICDQLNSVYMCELLWKQAVPLAKIAGPKIFSKLAGQSARGGVEYMGIESAWNTAKDSVAFFTDSYAINSVKAFRARSSNQGEIGSAVCKNFVSMSYPKGQSFLSNLVASDSPHQFKAEFNEINQNTITSPPISHYKVYFHIYSGKDRGAYYKVWLRGSETSFYRDQGATRIVDSGFVGVDDYASETIDFTAPSGYKELCVSVNDQEECGFKQVSSSFASNFFQDQYIKKQANRTDIKSEGECISGSPNLLALVNTNIQEGVSDVINPEIYNQGVNRICATDNPGISTDANFGQEGQRWMEVGHCGNEGMKCWLDLDTIDDAFVFEKTADDLKTQFSDNYDKNFLKENGYLDLEFGTVVRNITNEKTLIEKIILISDYMDKVFRNENKAYLYYLRAGAYAEIANLNFLIYSEELRKLKKNDVEIEERERIQNINDLVGGGDFTSNKFEVSYEGFSDNLCFKFMDDDWYWTTSCDTVGRTIRAGDEIERKLGQGTFEIKWDSVDTLKSSSSRGPNKKEAEWITGLRDKSYTEGFDRIRKHIKAGGSSSDFVESSDVNMDTVGTFTISDVEGIDNLYFKFIGSGDTPRWKWGYRYHKNLADWKELSLVDGEYQGSWLSAPGSYLSFLAPDPELVSMPEEYEKLKKVLLKKDEKDGALILFSDKDVWNKLSEDEIIIVRDRTLSEVLEELKNFEDDYNSDSVVINRNKVRDLTIDFVFELINEGWLNPEVEDLYAIDPFYSKGAYIYFSSDNEPNFEKIKAELEAVQIDRAIDISSLSMTCAQYSDRVNEAADKVSLVDANLIFAVMMRESSCGVNKESDSGCRGIMQFCSATAIDERLSEFNLCDSRGCSYNDNRMNDDISIAAGAKYLSILMNMFDDYYNGKTFAIAAYNGGEGLIDRAIKKTGSSDPSWNEVFSELTPEFLKDNGYGGSYWDDAKRIDKIEEIKHYVGNVTLYMGAELDGNDDGDINYLIEGRVETISDAITEIDSSGYDGTYTTNKKLRTLVEVLKSKKFITDSEYNGIKNNDYSAERVKSYLVANKQRVEGEAKVLVLRSNDWPIKETVEFISNELSGKYSKDDSANKYVVDLLCEDEVLLESDCIKIRAEGIWNIFSSTMDMNFVSGTLKFISLGKTGRNWNDITSDMTFKQKDLSPVIESEIKNLLSSDLDKDNQINNANPDLLGLITCLNSEYFKLDSKNIVVTSITDNDMYTNPLNCDLNDPFQIYQNDSYCVHQKDSCHYYPSKAPGTVSNYEVESMAIDLRSVNYDADKMNSALQTCNSKYPLKTYNGKYYLDEGSHFHVALAACSIASEEAIEEDSCEVVVIEPSDEVKLLSDARQKVLKTIEELDGTPRTSSATNCYTAVQYVYGKAGVRTEGSCVYSDNPGTQYRNGKIITQSSDATKPFFSNPNCLSSGYDEDRKLAGIIEGDLLSVIYDDSQAHNVIFIEWEDSVSRNAKIFDWNGVGGTYGYSTYDLSDEAHAVYMYWTPINL